MNNIPDQPRIKPFPWKCGECGERQVYLERFSYSCKIAHDGRTYEVEVAELETPRCRKCGEIVLTDVANDQISEALRSKLGLLSPTEIPQQRQAANL